MRDDYSCLLCWRCAELCCSVSGDEDDASEGIISDAALKRAACMSLYTVSLSFHLCIGRG